MLFYLLRPWSLGSINKVEIATKIPKKPRINIGEFGKSYTGTFIVIWSKI